MFHLRLITFGLICLIFDTLPVSAANINDPVYEYRIQGTPTITYTGTAEPSEGIPGTAVTVTWSGSGTVSGVTFQRRPKPDGTWTNTNGTASFYPDATSYDFVVPNGYSCGSRSGHIEVAGYLTCRVGDADKSGNKKAIVSFDFSITGCGGDRPPSDDDPPDDVPPGGGGGDGGGDNTDPHLLQVSGHTANTDNTVPQYTKPESHTPFSGTIEWANYTPGLYVYYDQIDSNATQPGFVPFRQTPIASTETSVDWKTYETYLKLTRTMRITTGDLSRPWGRDYNFTYAVANNGISYTSNTTETGWFPWPGSYDSQTTVTPPTTHLDTTHFRIGSASNTHTYEDKQVLSLPYSTETFISAFPGMVSTPFSSLPSTSHTASNPAPPERAPTPVMTHVSSFGSDLSRLTMGNTWPAQGHAGNPLDLSFRRTKFQFKWHPDVLPTERYPVSYLVLFTPQDDPMTPDTDEALAVEVLDTINFDDVNLSESPPYTLNIGTTKPGKLGTISLLSPALRVDANRNGVISASLDAEDTTSAANPFRFWSNNDDDNPGETPEKDYLNSIVDGEDDLMDFFPVFLDIKHLLTVLPPSATVKYKLKHADDGLNFVYTNLTRATAFSYQTGTLTTGFGPSFIQAAAVATTQQISAAGIELPAAFLTNIKDNDQGVILVEARQVSGAPLKLVVEKDNVQIAEVALNIASLRLYADPGKVHLGFDPPNKSEPEDLAAPSTYWASVVQGTTNTILNLDLPASALAGVEWKIAAADTTRVDISPKTFTSATTKLTITGLVSNLDAPSTITLVSSGSAGSAILTLKILVLPQRAPLSVGFFVIEDNTSSGTQFASSPSIPLPNFTAIRDVLNDTFKQAGVSFVVSANSGVYPEPYDTHRLIQNGGETSEVVELGQDGQLSQTEYQNNLPFGDAKYAADIQIFILKNSGRPYYSINPALNYPHLRIRGSNPSFPFRDIMLFARETVGYMDNAIAHEVGHKLGLTVNPDSTFPGSGHDDPPYALAVETDLPNGAPPPSMGSDFLPHPNRALMQSGWPIDGKMPWTHGRWMKHEDWKMANEEALRIKQ